MPSCIGRRRTGDVYADTTMPIFEEFAGTLLAIAGVVMTFRAHRSISLHERARSWPGVPGVVVRSVLRETTDGDGTSYRADISCSYSAGGHTYSTSRHSDNTSISQPEASARALIAAFPVGQIVEIRVDPSDAANGVLLSGKPRHMVVIRRVGLAALAGGLFLVLHGALRGPWP